MSEGKRERAQEREKQSRKERGRYTYRPFPSFEQLSYTPLSAIEPLL